MKKISIILLAFLSTFAFFACQKEEHTTDKNTKVTVHFGFSDETKATFDQEGIKWAAGDVIRFSDQGKGNVKDVTLSSSDISSDGYSATITEDFYLANKAVFRHNWSRRNAGEWDFGYMGNYAEGCSFVEWNKLTVTQSAAGQINKNFVLLHSGLTALNPASGTTEFSVKMEILGTILRVLPYTEAYNDEVIESVTLSSTDRLGGVVTVDYSNGQYRDHKDVNWGPDTFKEYKVSLATGFSLTGVTTREASKGFYFSLPATNSGHEIAGYTITVTTDKANYVFDGSAKTLSLAQNKVRNIYLKLENADTREDLTIIKGTYNFWGSIADGQTFEYNANAHTNDGLGYWVVSTKDDGATDRVTVEASAHPEYYVAQFDCIDDATGVAADWLTVGYRPNDTWWIATLQANPTSTARSATVTATFPDNNNGYTVESGFKTRTIHINQKGLAIITPVLGTPSSSTIPADGGSVTVSIDLLVDGVAATDAQFNEYIGEVTLTPENCSVNRSGHTLTITMGLNPKTETRTATLTATANGGSDSVSVTQDAAASAMAVTFSYGFSGWQGGNLSFSRSYDAEAHTQADWMIVLSDLKISTTNSTPVESDMPDLIKYAFQLSQAEYDAFADFVVLSYDISAGETKIWFQGVTANTGTTARVFDKWFKTSDLSSDYVHVTISQSKPIVPGANLWPDLTVNTDNSYYGPGWAATTFPAITKGASNSSYAFNIPTACNERWQCQLKLETNLPALSAAKTYTFSCTINCSNTNSVRIQFGSPGIGFPVDDDVTVEAGVAKNFTKDFTAAALVNSTLIFDFGWAPANTDVTITNISIAEKL